MDKQILNAIKNLEKKVVDLYYKVKISNSASSFVVFFNKIQAAYTGTTAETIIGTPILIPANTIKQNDLVQVAGIFQKGGLGGLWNIKVYISPEPNISAGKILYSPALITLANTSNIYSYNFESEPYIYKAGNLFGSTIRGTNATNNFLLNSQSFQTGITLFDPTIDNYLFATGQSTAIDSSITQHLLQIKIY